MIRSLSLLSALSLGTLLLSHARAAEKAAPKQRPRQQLPGLLQGTPEDFIKHFDNNKDGVLTKDELPPFLANIFARFDTNGDGQLDKQEVATLMQRLRQRMKNNPPVARPQQIERLVKNILERMDTDKDGKISRKEAKGRVAKFFNQLDTNKDGFVDKNELRELAKRILANRPGQGNGNGGRVQPNQPDFDALDLNADGRLTREELKGTRFADVFEQIDTNKDGKIDRKEFEAYLKKMSK